MIIELIGSSCAGKSTLVSNIIHEFNDQAFEIFTDVDFILKELNLRWVRGRLARTLLIDLVTLLACLAMPRKNAQLFLLALSNVLRLPPLVGWYERLNILRNTLKKIGAYEIIAWRSQIDQIVLMDEGPLQTAHYMFVHVSGDVNTDNLLRYISLIPVPQAVLYVTEKQSVLVDCISKRGHKRLPDLSSRNITRFVDRGLKTFETMLHHLIYTGRLSVSSVVGGHVLIIQCCANNSMHDTIVNLVRSGLKISSGDAVVNSKKVIDLTQLEKQDLHFTLRQYLDS